MTNKFVKGDWVEITHYPDYRWEVWNKTHTDMCGKRGKIVNIIFEEWIGEYYIEVEHRGKREWFRTDHLVKVDNYEVVFSEAVHDACEKLQNHERICKKLRDEILESVFGEEEKRKVPPEMTKEEEDQLYEDWEEATTKEVIPLPGNGGTMTDPKANASAHRKKVRSKKTKLAQKVQKKVQSKDTQDLADMDEDEIEELLEYFDSYQYTGTSNKDIDYDYLYDGDDDDTSWFT